MTPPELAKSNTEHAHQRALFAWAQIARRYGFAAADDPQCYSKIGYAAQTYGRNPRVEPNPSGKGSRWVDDGGFVTVDELEWLHTIPNGGRRDGFTAALMKAEGVKKGILDVFLPMTTRTFAGLYIEMKRPTTGRGKARQQRGSTSDVQNKFIAYARRQGYAVSVCFDWLAATREIIKYIDEARSQR